MGNEKKPPLPPTLTGMFQQLSRVAARARVPVGRSIYLHSGKRVQGLKRDPAEVLQTHSGAVYGATEENLRHVKGFLEAPYAVPDEMLLQALTHKSFGNGFKPYNEKLAALGSKVCNLFFLKHVVGHPTATATAVAGKNLDCIGMPVPRALTERTAMAVFAHKNNLNRVMFWKLYNHSLGFALSGEMKVSAQMMYALVGAVALVHGKQHAEEFVRAKLVGGLPSIEAIAAEVVKQNVRGEI